MQYEITCLCYSVSCHFIIKTRYDYHGMMRQNVYDNMGISMRGIWPFSVLNDFLYNQLTLLNSDLLLFLHLGKLQIVLSPSSPMLYYKGEPKDLKCSFSGWPLPREVQWYKNDEIITNGTESIFYSEDRKWKKGEETIRSTLHLPPGSEEHEGIYNCSAKNSIPGWKSEASQIIQMIYMCRRYAFNWPPIEWVICRKIGRAEY